MSSLVYRAKKRMVKHHGAIRNRNSKVELNLNEALIKYKIVTLIKLS